MSYFIERKVESSFFMKPLFVLAMHDQALQDDLSFY